MHAVAIKVISGAAAGRALMLVALLVVARILGPNEFGILALGLATSQMLGTVATLGLGRGATRLLPHYVGNQHWQLVIMRWSVRATVTAAVLIGVTLLMMPVPLFEVLIPQQGNWAVRGGVALWSLGFATSLLAQRILTGLQRQGRSATWVVVRSVVISSVLVVGAVSLEVPTLIFVCGASEALLALSMVGLIWVAQKRAHLPEAQVTNHSRWEILANGAPGWLSDIGTQAASWLLILGLTHLAGGAAVAGVFALGRRAFVAVTMVPRQAATAFVPFLVRARKGPAEAWRTATTRAARWTLLPAAGLVLIGTGAIFGLGDLLGGYERFQLEIAVMCALGLLGALNSLQGTVAQSEGRLIQWGTSDIVASVVTVCVASLTLTSWGLWGAIAAFAAGILARSVILALSFRERGRSEPRHIQ